MRITPQTTPAAIAILLSFPAGIGITADAAAATHSSEASSAATAPSIGAGVFGGFTSKGGPVVVELARNGKRIKRVVAGVELKCTSGDSLAVFDKWTQLPIRGSRFSGSDSGAFVEDGLRYEGSSSLKGKLNRKRTRISGSWRAQVVVRNPAGATTDSCDSGPLRFTARR